MSMVRSVLSWRLVALPAVACALYVALMAVPYPLFGYEAHFQNFSVYSDQAIPPAITSVLGSVQERLGKSPLNDPMLEHRIFICNANWRFVLFTNTNYRVGGENKTWLNQNIFLRHSDIKKNRLISPSDFEVPAERTLAYFITHEIVHTLEVHLLGRYEYIRLAAWKREGYADYVARDSNFVFPDRLAAFQQRAFEMDPDRSGLYQRYQLFVTFLLDRQHLAPEQMLRGSFAEAAIDQTLRAMP
jgi:hypothetical protein